MIRKHAGPLPYLAACFCRRPRKRSCGSALLRSTALLCNPATGTWCRRGGAAAHRSPGGAAAGRRAPPKQPRQPRQPRQAEAALFRPERVVGACGNVERAASVLEERQAAAHHSAACRRPPCMCLFSRYLNDEAAFNAFDATSASHSSRAQCIFHCSVAAARNVHSTAAGGTRKFAGEHGHRERAVRAGSPI